MKLIVGLGNPGEEYEETRHNTGFIVLDYILGKKAIWKESGITKGLENKNSELGKPAIFLKPSTFMNNSGNAVAQMKDKNKLKLDDIVIIYDDVDLPLGTMKISYDRSSGGHNGLNSIIKKLKSQEFVRIRVGIAPATPAGKIRKPKGEEAMLKFLLGKYKEVELAELKKLSKKIKEALEVLISEGRGKAMSLYN